MVLHTIEKIDAAVEDNTMVSKMMALRLLPQKIACAKCGNEMELRTRSKARDGVEWRCRVSTNVDCSSASVRKNTWFAKSRLTLPVILKIVVMWALKMSNADIADSLKVSAHTIVDYKNFCRDICAWANDRIGMLGGGEVVVECDESAIGIPKYHRGAAKETRWIFGMVERGGRAVAVSVEDRKAKTLTSIIKKRVLPGTTIISDEWRAYGSLRKMGYDHRTICHKKNFSRIDEQDELEVHTNTIEGFWSHMKAPFKRAMGTSYELMPSYISEGTYRYNNRAGKKLVKAFYADVAAKYQFTC
ncbi:DDE-Tnp-IS1595 domain-containing protein [Aphelenchoides besseyi]|nr:DDE-Tnp-IS1595 domain-containing protein [Aphelenchoides besseyi]